MSFPSPNSFKNKLNDFRRPVVNRNIVCYFYLSWLKLTCAPLWKNDEQSLELIFFTQMLSRCITFLRNCKLQCSLCALGSSKKLHIEHREFYELLCIFQILTTNKRENTISTTSDPRVQLCQRQTSMSLVCLLCLPLPPDLGLTLRPLPLLAPETSALSNPCSARANPWKLPCKIDQSHHRQLWNEIKD